ncbi:MAG: GNVR domain-containing protein [Candidatus Omnitrophota bacterium]
MQVNFMDYLQVFYRRKPFFLCPFIITVFVMVVLSFVLPKTFASRALILVEEEEVINPLITGLAISTPVSDRLRMLREQILSWNSLTELVKRLKLDSEIKSAFGYEELIKTIQKNITVNLRGQYVVEIAYLGEKPEQVKQVVSTLTDIFIQQNVRAKTKETEVAVKFLEEQLKLYRRKIKEHDIKILQEELSKLLVDSTENHPLVKNLEERIDRLKKALEKGEDSEVVIPKKSASGDQKLLSYLLLKELREADGPSSGINIPGAASEMDSEKYEGLPLDVTVNQNIYEMLLQRLETARITQQLEAFKEGTRFTVIDPPRLPLKPVKPDKIQFLFLGIALGVAIGYACVYLIEMVDTSFKDIHDASAGLEFSLLGAISAIITEDEFDRKRQSARFVYTLMGIFFILMVVTVLIVSFVR